jgi:ketosteroid isomerase-like protein
MSGAEQEIRRLEEQIGQAIVGRDTAFVERVWDEAFSYTGVRGERKTKADILAELSAGSLQFNVMRFDDIDVRLHGDTAVVSGLAITEGKNAQGPIVGQFRYTRVFVKKAGQWKLVAFQGSPPVAPAAGR